MPNLSKLKLLIATLVISLLITGCSTRFLYNQLDWLVPWYLQDYVSIEESEPHFSQQLEKFLDWHRYNQLPKYAEFLAGLESKIENNQLSAENIDHTLTQIDGFADSLLTEFGTQFAPIMANFSAEQVVQLLKNLDKKNQEYREEFIEIGETQARKQQFAKTAERLETWLGTLDQTQREILLKRSKALRWIAPEFYKVRLAWRARLAHIFELPASQRAEQIQGLFANRKQLWTPETWDNYSTNRTLIIDLTLQLSATLNQSQRAHLLRKLADYQQDFVSLSANF